MKNSYDVNDGKLTNVKYKESSFYCSNENLTTLEGCPEIIKQSFDCSNNKLTSLKGCPKATAGSFFCSNNKLTSLENGPQKVYGLFDCSNNKLTDLQGCPQIIIKLNCSRNKLTTLNGCPKSFTGADMRIDCAYNRNLIDISDIPSNTRKIYIAGCPKIQKFPKNIESQHVLEFISPSKDVRQKIKEQSFYEIIEEDKVSIRVTKKEKKECLILKRAEIRLTCFNWEKCTIDDIRNSFSYKKVQPTVSDLWNDEPFKIYINTTHRNGDTPLILAAQYNEDPQIIQSIVDLGANINKKNLALALQHAVMYNKNPKIIEKLVQLGANINQSVALKEKPLMLATKFNPNPLVVKILIDLGADINVIDDYDGLSALTYAKEALEYDKRNRDIIQEKICYLEQANIK